MSPYLGGLGLASAVVAFNVAIYYNTIIAWCLKYLVQVNIRLILVNFVDFRAYLYPPFLVFLKKCIYIVQNMYLDKVACI